MVGHEVCGSDPRVVGMEVDRCAVGCVSAEGRKGEKETTVRMQKTEADVLFSAQTQHFGRAIQLPLSTLDVGIVGQKHGQKPHEVVSHWPLLPAGRHGPAVHAG